MPLPFLESIGAFLLLECGRMTKPSGAHARSNLRHRCSTIFTSQQRETSGLNGLFVEARRDEQEETARGAQVEFVFANLARDDSDIGKHYAPLAAKKTCPVAQRSGSIWQVRDGIDA
jgi:hypothetical protein